MAEVSLVGTHGVDVNFDAALHMKPDTSVAVGAGMMMCCADAHGLIDIVHIDDTIIRRHQ